MKSYLYSHERLTKRQRQILHGKLTNFHVAQIGGEDERLVLQGVYDKDQHWFSFMTGALFLTDRRSRYSDEPDLYRKIYQNRRYIDRYTIRQLLAEPFKVEKAYRKLVNYDTPGQYILPFHEARKLTVTEFKALAKDGYPGFDRDEQGRIFKFKVKMAGWKLRGERKDARDWCEEMCNGRYYITTQYAYFALAHDALLAKLAFG